MDCKKEALNQAFVSAWNDGKHERVLKPIASLQAWIEQHVFLQLDKVPFPKDDTTLVPEEEAAWNAPRVSTSYSFQTQPLTNARTRIASITNWKVCGAAGRVQSQARANLNRLGKTAE